MKGIFSYSFSRGEGATKQPRGGDQILKAERGKRKKKITLLEFKKRFPTINNLDFIPDF